MKLSELSKEDELALERIVKKVVKEAVKEAFEDLVKPKPTAMTSKREKERAENRAILQRSQARYLKKQMREMNK